MPIGWFTKKPDIKKIIAPSLSYSEILERLVATAKKTTQMHNFGWLSRGKNGVGENFWQFRLYQEGDNPHKIDWRRSAKDDKLYIREHEWETQQKIWIWPDQSRTMLFQSQDALRSKIEHALLIGFIIGELFVRSGDPIAIPGISKIIMHKDGAEKMALSLLNFRRLNEEREKNFNFSKFPDFHAIKAPCDLILIGDFICPLENNSFLENALLFQELKNFSAQQARVHLIEIIDPAEEKFPYKNSVIFQDILSNEEYIAQKAEDYQKDYRNLYFQKRKILTKLSSQNNWTYLQSYTNQPLENTLSQLSRIFLPVCT